MTIENRKKLLVLIPVLCIVALAFLIPTGSKKQDADGTSSQQDTESGKMGGHATRSASGTSTSDSSPKTNHPVSQSLNAVEQEELDDIAREKDPELQKLQELLDNDYTEEAQALASSLLNSSDRLRRLAAIESLAWIGGTDSASLIAMHFDDSDEEVADEALDAFLLILDGLSSLESGDLMTLWQNAIVTYNNEILRDSLLVRLTSRDDSVSLPALINLLQTAQSNNNADLIEQIQDYISFVTHGETDIDTIEKAEEWLAEQNTDSDITTESQNNSTTESTGTTTDGNEQILQ